MDGRGAQAFLVGIAEGWERRLERYFQKLREDSYADSGGESRSEVLSPTKQPESPATQI